MINVGLNSLSAIRVGTDSISKAYQGSTLVYDTTPSTYEYLATRYEINTTGSTKIANQIQYNVTTMKVDGVEVPASTAYTFTSTGRHTIEWIGASMSVPSSGFTNVSTLVEAILPSGMTTLNNSCFRNCSNLAHVNLENISHLGTYVFAESGIREAVLGNVTTIPNGTFFRCQSLTALTPYTSSYGTTGYTLPSTVTEIKSDAFALADTHGMELFIPSGVTSLGDSVFATCNINYIELPDGLLTIGRTCFSDTMLQVITIPSSVTYMQQFCLASVYDVYFDGQTPPNKEGDLFTFFDGRPSVVERIYVPAGSKTAYDEAFPAYTDLIYERS